MKKRVVALEVENWFTLVLLVFFGVCFLIGAVSCWDCPVGLDRGEVDDYCKYNWTGVAFLDDYGVGGKT